MRAFVGTALDGANPAKEPGQDAETSRGRARPRGGRPRHPQRCAAAARRSTGSGSSGGSYPRRFSSPLE